MSNIYYREKLTFWKLLRNKMWRNALAWKSKKEQGKFGETLFWDYCFRLPFVYKTMSQISFNLFAQKIKDFCQSSLGNEVDFSDIMNVSPNILAKNYNLKKLRHDSVDERALITTTLISSFHWKTLVTFCLQKKRRENTNYAIQNNSKLSF